MGDTSLVALEPHAVDTIQSSDTIEEKRAEKSQAESLLANREGAAKDLASRVHDRSSSASVDPTSIQVNQSPSAGIPSDESLPNANSQQNGNQTVMKDKCTELKNKKGLSVIENNNGGDLLENDFGLEKNIETEDRSANGSRFQKSGSSAGLLWESNGAQEAMGNSGGRDDGQKEAKIFILTETPQLFDQGTPDIDASATVDEECLATDTVSLKSENLNNVQVPENKKVPETLAAETPMKTETGQGSHPGRNIDDSEEDTRKRGADVDELEFPDLQHIRKSENGKKQSGSRVDTFSSTNGVVHPTVSESCLESRPDDEADNFHNLSGHAKLEERGPSKISEQSFTISSWGSFPDQGSPSTNPLTALVSDDLEGWHRFDTEEQNNNNTVYGTCGSNQESHQPELWEQLLEGGEEAGHEAKEIKDKENISSVVSLGRESPGSDHNFQIGFSSPGNPFLEGLDRLSNFSEAEGFVLNNNMPSSRFSQSLEMDTSLCAVEDSSSIANEKDEVSSGGNSHFTTTSGKQETIAAHVGRFPSSASELVAPFGNKLQSEVSDHSLVGNSGSSKASMEPFEAPSFMSLVDPESNELFKASMPTYGAKTTLPPQENGGESWVADFDSMMPQISSPQEVARTVSLPPVNTSGVLGEEPGIQSPVVTSPSSKRKQAFSPSRIWNSLSRKSPTPSASPNSRSSAASPKMSPLVKKMVQKVQTIPGLAMQASNTSSNPKNADGKSKQRPTWSCCTCFHS